jgi:hypothetical protein
MSMYKPQKCLDLVVYLSNYIRTDYYESPSNGTLSHASTKQVLTKMVAS